MRACCCLVRGSSFAVVVVLRMFGCCSLMSGVRLLVGVCGCCVVCVVCWLSLFVLTAGRQVFVIRALIMSCCVLSMCVSVGVR